MNASPPGSRQTLSYLRSLFDKHGIRPKNKLGQNFLIDLNLLDVLLQAAELTPEDLALEVGSGTGSLTARLVEQAGAVVSVEVDPAFAGLTDELIGDSRDRIVLLHADALKSKNELNPLIYQAISELQTRLGTKRLKLVANLPYAVATPVISNLLLSEVTVERMVVTVQWEIAERLLAEPGNKDYGALSILVQSIADVSLVRKLPPAVFWPRPQVDSAIVTIRPSLEKRALVGDVVKFREFLRDLYAHRRKNLRGGLVSMAGRGLTKSEVDKKLAELGIEGTVRAETLDIERHLRLCQMFA